MNSPPLVIQDSKPSTLTQTPNPDIIRDAQYNHVLKKDMARQRWRRRAHRLHAWWEQQTRWPQWENVGHTDKTLSVCLITMNSAHRIAPVLQYLRPWVDELVVGVDSKTTDLTLAVCQQFSDECFIIDNPAATCNGGLEALVARCHGDWVLRLDDDELIDPAFIRMKAALMSQDRYTHFKLPRLHLSQLEPLTWVDDGYLFPDYQLRLFVNDPQRLTFPGPVGHLGIECEGPRGKLASIPLIHLNLAINSRQQREAKLKRYVDRLNGGWVHPVNETCLLFEDFNYCCRPYEHINPGWVSLLKSFNFFTAP